MILIISRRWLDMCKRSRVSENFRNVFARRETKVGCIRAKKGRLQIHVCCLLNFPTPFACHGAYDEWKVRLSWGNPPRSIVWRCQSNSGECKQGASEGFSIVKAIKYYCNRGLERRQCVYTEDFHDWQKGIAWHSNQVVMKPPTRFV